MTAPNRRWPRFGLRTLFIAVAVFGCWLGYYIHWIRERQVGREWLDAHKTDFIECGMRLEVAIPWPLRLLGESPIEDTRIVGPLDVERQSLPEFKRQVAEMKELFPESHIVTLGLRRESEAPDLSDSPPPATN